MVDLYEGPSREGTRGGLEQFTWDSVKGQVYKDRECYLGQSVRVGVQGKFGRFSTNDWWIRKREDPKKINEEQNLIKRFEEELMQEALGVKPKRLLLIRGDLTDEQRRELLEGGKDPAAASTDDDKAHAKRKRKRRHAHYEKDERHRKHKSREQDYVDGDPEPPPLRPSRNDISKISHKRSSDRYEIERPCDRLPNPHRKHEYKQQPSSKEAEPNSSSADGRYRGMKDHHARYMNDSRQDSYRNHRSSYNHSRQDRVYDSRNR